ncbi:DUF2971 domain-containing protein [Herbaspirillum rubrisubalbicans]|uniref:DUF2971 domain-containing protein n=1 Tax=Herbaspirillum rubrisubalbicans TaxID=80842 RepID=UPI001559185C|nr:DUF2971 domain-containing protein [Herbaspirillum rubrisubalbicans]
MLPNRSLFHYTSGHNLLNIIRGDELWATHILYMNDAHELEHATQLASHELSLFAKSFEEERPQKICMAILDTLRRAAFGNMYVACFSEVRDSLGQWRGYCPPNLGYALEFDADKLMKVASAHNFMLRPCIYDHPTKQALIKSWAKETLDQLLSLPDDGRDIQEFCDSNMGWPLEKMREIGPFLKDSSFAEEREWRMAALVLDPTAGDLRAGKSFLVPYVPIKLGLKDKETPLWGLTVGPTPHRELAMHSLSKLFQKIHIPGSIGHTMIPFRDW